MAVTNVDRWRNAGGYPPRVPCLPIGAHRWPTSWEKEP